MTIAREYSDFVATTRQTQSGHVHETYPDFFGTSLRVLFLESLRSQGRYKYARYKGLPLRYAGGKSLGVGHVVEQMPDGLETLVSPFMGGGAVEIACAAALGIQVQAYDIFDILVNYWQVQLTSSQQLAEKLERWHPTKARYAEVKQKLKAHWQAETRIENPLELAAHYWFNHNLSYGPGFLGWMSKIYESPGKYARAVKTVRNFQCPLLSVQHGSFEETIPRHPCEFLYCDPPYYLGEGKMFKGIYPQPNFPVHHNGFQHELLRDLLYAHDGGFVLSYNDCETIRQWYADFRIFEVEWQYTFGQGETRIGKNRAENKTGNVKQSHELLVVKDM